MILNANALHLPIASNTVQCVVTSPPYYGLRDYGVSGQLGLEPTPDEYVQNLVKVFREVWRVMRDDGTLWVNLGDSYWGGKGQSSQAWSTENQDRNTLEKSQHQISGKGETRPTDRKHPEIKSKDLIGIPWSVAKALQQPFYTGRIKSELDRVWLAATIDAEGTICGFDMIRNDDGSPRTGVNITITNSSERLLDNAERIYHAQKYKHDQPNHLGNLPMFRWQVNGIDEKLNLLQEIYPYLVAKKEQALLAYNLLLFMSKAKHDGHTPQKQEARDKRSYLASQISNANKQAPFSIPDWCIEPPKTIETGWYLRSDIIWHKPNPMPESVTDRPTKSHEYLFLLTKNAKYYYDADAIKEPVTDTSMDRYSQDIENQIGSDRVPGKTNGNMKAVLPRYGGNKYTADPAVFNRTKSGNAYDFRPLRNKRSVWQIATQPTSYAHFATFPEKLVEPCILAGSKQGDWVMDPFAGSGTTGRVAIRYHRNFVGTELNFKYISEISHKRLTVNPMLFLD